MQTGMQTMMYTSEESASPRGESQLEMGSMMLWFASLRAGGRRSTREGRRSTEDSHATIEEEFQEEL